MGNVTYLSITFYGYIIYELYIGVFVNVQALYQSQYACTLNDSSLVTQY